MARVSWFSRLYVWSVVLEPLLFFVVFDRGVFGITGNIARVLQGLVVAGLALRGLLWLLTPGMPLKRRSSHLPWYFHRDYVRYMALAVVAGLVGMWSGAYSLSKAYASVDETGTARLLNSANLRPLFEYVIAAYYFWYFAVLPRTFLRTPASVEYMFTAFRRMFVLSYAVGAVDLASAMLLGHGLVPRHLADGTMVGARFHGLAGEPRHAFVYLFFGLAMLHLRAWSRGERLTRWWTAAIVLAALLTQSASGLLGIVAFVALFIVYSLRNISFRRALQLAAVVAIVGALSYVAAANSERIIAYGEDAGGVWSALSRGERLPGALVFQADSIYPLYDLARKALSGNLLPVLIGSGFGSASAVNNRLDPAADALTNPNSQMVRSLYETGLVGTVLFILAFVRPVGHLTRPLAKRDRHRFMTLMLLVLGCCFGFRSAAVFIFLGAIAVTIPPTKSDGLTMGKPDREARRNAGLD